MTVTSRLVRNNARAQHQKRLFTPTYEPSLHSILQQAQFILGIISSPFPSATSLIEMDDQLIGGWLASLPPFFAQRCTTEVQVPTVSVHYPMAIPQLSHPHVPSIPGEQAYDTAIRRHPRQRSVCRHCCPTVSRCSPRICRPHLHILDRRLKKMMACWYGLYFLFQAILIPVICLRNDPQSPLVVSWRDQISKAMPVLESMGQLNPTALRCLGVIRSLCGTYLDPSMDGWGRPTEESPQTPLASLYPLMWPTLEMAQLDGVDSILQESTIMDFMNQLPGLE